MLRVSYRQPKRLYAAYLEKGGAGLIRGNAGKRSNRRAEESVLKKAVEAYRARYGDFGPTFAAEEPAEAEGIQISVSVLRRQLIASGDWLGSGGIGSTGAWVNGGPVLGNRRNLTGAAISGLRGGALAAAL
jgi:hypothetical protein